MKIIYLCFAITCLMAGQNAMAYENLTQITTAIEKLEQKKGSLSTVPNLESKLDEIRGSLLEVPNNDPHYTKAMKLTDRYIALASAAKNERNARENRPLSKSEQAKLDKEVAKEKRSQGVSVGMTAEDALASSWGRPQYKNVTTGIYGTHEQWVYRGNQYLYFENGILTSMQTH